MDREAWRAAIHGVAKSSDKHDKWALMLRVKTTCDVNIIRNHLVKQVRYSHRPVPLVECMGNYSGLNLQAFQQQ